jgi:hypothetical protein
MLKTLLYYWYEHEGMPYEKPPHYYLHEAEDQTEVCKAYIRTLNWWRMMKISLETPRKERLYTYTQTKIYSALLLKQPISQKRDWNESDGINPDHRGSAMSVVLGWITKFWRLGWNILEYLYLTLQYTEEFFTEEDVLTAMDLAEQELKLVRNQLHDDWTYLKDSRGTTHT